MVEQRVRETGPPSQVGGKKAQSSATTGRPAVSPEKKFLSLLRARITCFWVSSSEERRAERKMAAAVDKLVIPVQPPDGPDGKPASVIKVRFATRFWDCFTGITDIDGKAVDIGPISPTQPPANTPAGVFQAIRQSTIPAVWILRDLDSHLKDPRVERGLKSTARDLQDVLDASRLGVVVVLTASDSIPLGLQGSVTHVTWPLPDRSEARAIVREVIASCAAKITGGTEEDVVDAAMGMRADGIADAIALSIAETKHADPVAVASEKKREVDKTPGLTWYHADPRGLDAIGGLHRIIPWLVERASAFTPEARSYGLPPVKGVLVVGPPGTGKSLLAKCISTTYGIPLVKLDLGALKGGIVGQSEGQIRQALARIEAIGRCVVWIDELEKATAGSSGRSLDSGVSADQLGTLLTFMEETTLPIFFIATSNNPLALAPELISRFDDTFFVDLPTRKGRAEILAKTLLKFDRDPNSFDLQAVAVKTPGFSGRELAKLVASAMFKAFANGARQVTTDDLLAVAAVTIPVSTSAAASIKELQEWANQRARPASDPEDEVPTRPAGTYQRLTIDASDPLAEDDTEEALQ